MFGINPSFNPSLNPRNQVNQPITTILGIGASGVTGSVRGIRRKVLGKESRKIEVERVEEEEAMFSCSQQSIFSAMDRFVKAVNNMDATVLVPSKLRDMEISSNGGSNGISSSHSSKVRLRRIPPALANTPDLYSFYIMLNEVKKELLWGPGTGAVAAATMGSSVGGLMAAASSSGSTGLSGRSSPGRDSTGTNTSSNHSSSNHSCLLHSSASIASSLITSSSSGCPSSIGHGSGGGQTSSSTAKQHSRQPSDDSLGSIGSSTVSSSEHDTDSEVDSLLTDRDSVGDEHTSHLAAAFRHHLQGLHTILHQLADSADYLSSRYQEEIDASSL